ncbi:MAG: prepilin peptidase [Chloroflexi bacterium]|nr:prepilin peptidase [Chloroflexota bacterium]
MLNILFALIGLIVGVIINMLADALPERERAQRPFCLQCGHVHGGMGFLALARRQCAQCGAATRKREWMVEGGTAVLFAALPFLIAEPVNLVVNSFHIAILILVIVIDLENKLILNVVTFPATALAVLGSLIVTPDENSWKLSLVGAAVGFALFYLFYGVGRLLFGSGALGFGDVKLSMAMGAMLGFHRIFFALILAVLLGGVVSLFILLINRRVNKRTYLPYGQYLAIAGIVMLIWGVQVFQRYTN